MQSSPRDITAWIELALATAATPFTPQPLSAELENSMDDAARAQHQRSQRHAHAMKVRLNVLSVFERAVKLNPQSDTIWRVYSQYNVQYQRAETLKRQKEAKERPAAAQTAPALTDALITARHAVTYVPHSVPLWLRLIGLQPSYQAAAALAVEALRAVMPVEIQARLTPFSPKTSTDFTVLFLHVLHLHVNSGRSLEVSAAPCLFFVVR